ncbi:MAG: hypothetical protein H6933_14690 [Burkholderiaceae bacterium]|nr:hypothetical protein [Burkholderiaceae bacterium]
MAPLSARYLNDERFGNDAFATPGETIFQASTEMRVFVAAKLRRQAVLFGPITGLTRVLNDESGLRLRYLPEVTRTAAEAFAHGDGDCLSFVLITAAFADMLGLRVEFSVS